MGADQPIHWVILLVLAALLFGGYKKLPEMARSAGRSMRVFKTELKGLEDDDAARANAQAPQPPDPAAYTQPPAYQPAAYQPAAYQPAAYQPAAYPQPTPPPAYPPAAAAQPAPYPSQPAATQAAPMAVEPARPAAAADAANGLVPSAEPAAAARPTDPAAPPHV